MSIPYTIRPATPQDWSQELPRLMQALHEYVLALHPPLPTWDAVKSGYPGEMQKSMLEKDGAMFVAEAGGALVGYAFCWINHERDIEAKPEHWRYGYIKDIYVAPELQGSGAGKALMEAACTHLKERGANIVKLHVVAENRRAVEFYEHLGFGNHVILTMKEL